MRDDLPASTVIDASATTAHVPAKRLSGFYFGYYAAIGALVPYLGLYLVHRGLDAAQIGVVLGLLALTRIVAPYGWGVVADRSGWRMPVVLATLGGAALSFLLLPQVQGVTAIALVILLYGLLANGTMGQFEVVTFGHLDDQPQRYSRIRVWGSIGFVVMVLGLGPLLDWLGIATLPWFIAGFLAAAWLIGLRIPSVPLRPVEVGSGLLSVLRRRTVIALLMVCLLAQVSFGPYYGFYSLFLEEHGYRKSLIGALWALGVLAEIALFWWIPRRLPRYSLRHLLVLSQLASALRWSLTPLAVGSLLAMSMVQLLHAFSFGFYHLAAVNLVQRYFPRALQGQGQAIYIGMAYGVGGALGGWGAGQLWGDLAHPLIWFIAAGLAAVAAWIGWAVIDHDIPTSMIATLQDSPSPSSQKESP